MPKSLVVVIPSFNNARWCRRNLESVLDQAYPLYRVIYIDDASTDGTPDLVDQATFWLVAGAPQAQLGWAQRHLPRQDGLRHQRVLQTHAVAERSKSGGRA